MLLKSSSGTPLWGSDSRLMTSGRMLYTALPCTHTEEGGARDSVFTVYYRDIGHMLCMYRDICRGSSM